MQTMTTQHRQSQLWTASYHLGTYQKHYLTLNFVPVENPLPLIKQAGAFIRTKQAAIISQFIFGGLDSALAETLKNELQNGANPDWPVTWLAGDPAPNGPLTSMQIEAVSGLAVDLVTDKTDRVVGSVFEDPYFKVCRLGGLVSSQPEAMRLGQAASLFEDLQGVLHGVGMNFNHVARTWLYLDQLLDWYDGFNVVRTAFFNKYGVFEQLVPASTGIGAGNVSGAAMVLDALALIPHHPEATVREVLSPLQCPATNYKSSFSRAVSIETPAYKQLLISGTASIEPGGRTVHLDDTMAQIELTMQVVKAMLDQEKMSWNEVCRAIIYFKHDADIPLFYDYLAAHKLPDFPAAVSHADVCRDDLLFEIELDAIKVRKQ